MEFSELIEQEYNSISKTEGENGFRKKAYQQFLAAGIPTIKHEEWKYTDFNKVLKNDYFINHSDLKQEDINQFLFPELDVNLIVLVNGFVSPTLSKITNQIGVDIKNIKEVAKEVDQEIDSTTNPFLFLNAALSTNGVYIKVADNTIADKPIYILNICDKRNISVLAQPKNYIKIGKNAQVKIIEAFYCIGSNNSFTNIYTEVHADENSVSELYKLQLGDNTSSLVDSTNVYQSANSIFTCSTITLSGNIVRNNLNLILNGEYCEGNMNGLYLLNGNTLVDNHSSVDHAVPNCLSNELYKGILDEKSTGVFNGKIFVRKDAQKTNAYQSNKNLLISDEAVVNTKPQLEIWANDVKCSHGATIGKMDKDMLFYLEARGISKKSARAILMNAFAHDVIDKISLTPLKEYLNKLILKRLGLDFLNE
ncbi:MAG: Fe-S cluster assembly protein SufD [Opitutaceae bacterium]|nr:Fe-S cluster assembly protein SufD [Cytophagales bacterium]